MENKVIQNAGFHHIALYASDFERSFKFYTEGLGFNYVRGWGEGLGRIVMLDFGGGALLELFAKGAPEEQQNAKFIHLAIATTDPDGAYAAALAAGAVLRGAAMYSSMEPCSRRASEPESCTQLIIRHGFARAAFALYEPDCFVCCRGAQTLREAGVDVRVYPELAEGVRRANAHLGR